ncbi:F-box/WD repeat-containing protein 5 [Culicoides brevitarsis]|uniref:F-box/WD repeat-containing protein 5 n=1 Tax=Culicoides brevitarsis TaxID=469753 RepID=UPI00307BB7D6
MDLENRLKDLGKLSVDEEKVKVSKMSEKSDAIAVAESMVRSENEDSCRNSDDDESESFDNSEWVYMPENVLVKIMMYLEVKEVIDMGCCCKRWFRISRDDWIWRKLFQKDFGLPLNKKVGLKPGAETWYSEYRRLTYNVPMVLTDVLTAHSHQVLHVSFSHSGKLFCTCSKDGFVIVWNSSYPSTKKYSYDMKTLSWKYTQFSQFNSTDTLLLVSGVHFGVQNSTSGEIAVFSLDDDMRLKCRIVNRPYDIFGTWYTDQYLLSGDLHWLQHLISSSVIWINKASQEITSENVPIMNKLFRFYNRNASSVRSIMVAECPWLRSPEAKAAYMQEERPPREKRNPYDLSYLESAAEALGDEYCAGNPISQAVLEQVPGPNVLLDVEVDVHVGAEQHWGDFPYASTFQYSDEFRRNVHLRSLKTDDTSDDVTIESFDEIQVANDVAEPSSNTLNLPSTSGTSHSPVTKTPVSVPSTPSSVPSPVNPTSSPSPEASPSPSAAKTENDVDVDDLENAPPKYLIFSTGSKAYVPHQIAFKLVEKVSFPKQLDPGPSLKERIALRNMRRESESEYEEPDWSNFDAVSGRFDKIDKIIDLHGQIIGMALSPDHRYLYVNCRPWPQNYVIRNPLEPPPIAQEIDIHVIDLVTFKKVGKMLRAHRAYTPNTDCFFIFLDVCDDYVASGAEDMHAYVWERYYGVWLAKYNHSDVVNSVAFNPRDNEMLVTTSDDYEIKIWRSLEKTKEMNIPALGRATRFKPRVR